MKKKILAALLAAALCLGLLAGCAEKPEVPGGIPATSAATDSQGADTEEDSVAVKTSNLETFDFESFNEHGRLQFVYISGATIHYTLDGTDPLVGGKLEGSVSTNDYIRLPAGVNTVKARCESSNGQISDLIEDAFDVSYNFDSASTLVVEDSRYEYFTTGSGPLYRSDKQGLHAEVVDENTPSYLAAFEYDWQPSGDTYLPEYISQNKQRISLLYYLTGKYLNTVKNQHYYSDGRDETSTEKEKTECVRLEAIGENYLLSEYSDGSGSAQQKWYKYALLSNREVEKFTLFLSDVGSRVEQSDGKSLILNHEDETIFEVEGHDVVLDAVWSDWFDQHTKLFYHYRDNPGEHYVYTDEESLVNKQMSGKILLGYTENGVYFLDENGQAVREPFDYSIYFDEG
jgi:hypothetical protein